jgi:hypothetical protein
VAGVKYAASNGGLELFPGYRHKLTKAPIGEWNLWGRLREVVVGTPEGTVIPRFEPVFEKAADPRVLKLMKEHEGELLKDVLPGYHAAIEEESGALAAVYESHGVKVHFPRPVTPEEVAYSLKSTECLQ